MTSDARKGTTESSSVSQGQPRTIHTQLLCAGQTILIEDSTDPAPHVGDQGCVPILDSAVLLDRRFLVPAPHVQRSRELCRCLKRILWLLLHRFGSDAVQQYLRGHIYHVYVRCGIHMGSREGIRNHMGWPLNCEHYTKRMSKVLRASV